MKKATVHQWAETEPLHRSATKFSPKWNYMILMGFFFVLITDLTCFVISPKLSKEQAHLE
jgi:hypothetical protein